MEVSVNNKAKVIEVRKNQRGYITDVVLENGNVYSFSEAIIMAQDGLLEGVDAEQLRAGAETAGEARSFSRQTNIDELDILD